MICLMRRYGFLSKLIGFNLGKLCRQRKLLAGLVLLCLFLPVCISSVAEVALSSGASFSGITLAITGSDEDPMPEKLEMVLQNMQDISQYCRVETMPYEEALLRLREGTVTAVLVIPESFVQGVMNGTNPDVQLIVSGSRPVEALLTLWIGQSASDLLAAVQSGITTVLRLYSEEPPEELSYQTVVTQINLRYINWTVNREQMFDMQTVSATGQLPIGVHYTLSLLLYLILAAAPFFVSLYDKKTISSQCRFHAVGWSSGAFWFSSLMSCWMLIFPMLVVVQYVVLKGKLSSSIITATLCGMFCAVFCSICCLLTDDSGRCGMLSFTAALLMLFFSGGILPPVLMPYGLRKWIELSPITWMRSILAVPLEIYEIPATMAAALVVCTAVLIIIGSALYKRRATRREDGA